MTKNDVSLSVVISNDINTEKGTVNAVRKVSDKLTVVNTYVPGRKNADGTWGASASIEVNVVEKTNVSGVEIKPGTHIDVEGFLSPRSYQTKDGHKRSYLALVAKKITATEISNASTSQNTSQTAPAQSAGTQTAPVQPTRPQVANEGFMNAPEGIDDDLPFEFPFK